MKGYSTREVEELLAMPAETIRILARAGILDPERDIYNHYRFSFQDIIILRTAKEMLDAGVTKARINHALFHLKQTLPSNRPLTALRISGDGGAVVVHENEQIYEPESGQVHFNFSIAELAGNVAPLARKAAKDAEADDELTSDDWFDLGVDLEAVSPDDAPAAYMRALALDSEHSDAHVNLGRLLQESSQFEAAEDHYHKALSSDPENVLAAFNLGTLMEDLGRVEEAIDAYKRACDFADAHFNLSRLFELIGNHKDALKHLRTYRTLIDPGKH